MGILAGLAGPALLTGFLSSLLFNVKATDPLTFVSMALVLALVRVIASLIPAYRAIIVDPVNAIRQE